MIFICAQNRYDILGVESQLASIELDYSRG